MDLLNAQFGTYAPRLEPDKYVVPGQGVEVGEALALEEGEDPAPAGQGEELGLHTDSSDVHKVPWEVL